MRIGIDLDNTIAGYDRVFPAAAEREGLSVPGAANTKSEIRAALQAQAGGEQEWMRLQGRVYGAHMHEAELIEGVAAFLHRCRERQIDVSIVSHKTEFGHFDSEQINLRTAARKWMEANRFFDKDGFGLEAGKVFFEATRAEKVARIRKIECTHFIDDLIEVFEEPGFPADAQGYLLANGDGELPKGRFTAYRHWDEITDDIFGTC